MTANSPSPQAVSLLPDGDPCTLRDCPPGPFLFNGHVGFKTEYCAMEPDGPTNIPGSDVRWKVGKRPDAYVLDSGECFWGGTSTPDARDMLIVQPLASRASPADGVVVPRGEVTDEWADRFCEAINWSPDGQECKVVEGEMRCVTFRQIAKGHILAAIATGPDAASPALAATSGGGEAVAWRWRFDDDGLTNWYYGAVAPGNKAGQRSMMEPSEVQPLYTTPPSADADKLLDAMEACDSIEHNFPGQGDLDADGKINARGWRRHAGSVQTIREALALLSSNTGEG